MPRVPRTGDQKAQYYLNKFPGEFTLKPNGYLDRLLCLCTIKANKFSNLVSHRAGKKHTRLLNQRDTETARLEFMLNDDAPPPDDHLTTPSFSTSQSSIPMITGMNDSVI